MRKVTYGGAISLDGFLAGPGESIDWLRHSDDTAKIAAESFRGVDSMLMGRKTWEFAQRMGGRPPLKGVTTYVFSRTLESVGEGATLVKEDAAEFVRRMKGEAGGPSSSLATSNILVMGGGRSAARFSKPAWSMRSDFRSTRCCSAVACLHSSHSPTASDLS